MAPFADLLAKQLARKGWSQRELARRLQVSQPTVARWSNGRRPVPQERVRELADLFELNGVERGAFVLAALLTGSQSDLAPLVGLLVELVGDRRALVAISKKYHGERNGRTDL